MPHIIQNLFRCGYLLIAFFPLQPFSMFCNETDKGFQVLISFTNTYQLLTALKNYVGFLSGYLILNTNNFLFGDIINGKINRKISLFTPVLYKWPALSGRETEFTIMPLYGEIRVSKKLACSRIFYVVQPAAIELLILKKFILSFFSFFSKLIGSVFLTFLIVPQGYFPLSIPAIAIW